MKVLYVTQYYAPESIAAAFRAEDHASAWAKQGHEITVLTAWPNHPKGVLFPGYNMSRLGHEFQDGVDIYRSELKINQNPSFRKRTETGLSFLHNGLKNLAKDDCLKNMDFDIVLASSGTIFAGMLGAEYARRANLPLVVEFRDLAFDQIAASQHNPSNWKVRVMRMLELRLAKQANRIVVLTQGFKKRLCEYGINENKIDIVFNGVDPIDCNHPSREAHQSEIRFGYFGTIGISQDVIRTIDLLDSLKKDVKTTYSIIGDGACFSQTRHYLEEHEHSCATLAPGVSPEELEAHYENIDMAVVSLQHSPSFSSTIPSKIFQAFARGIPVLFIGPEGEASSIIKRENAGIVLTGDDSKSTETLRSFFGHNNWKTQIQTMAHNAKKLSETRFSRSGQAKKMIEILERTAAGRTI